MLGEPPPPLGYESARDDPPQSRHPSANWAGRVLGGSLGRERSARVAAVRRKDVADCCFNVAIKTMPCLCKLSWFVVVSTLK